MLELPVEKYEVSWKGPSQCEGCGIRDIVLFSSLEKDDFSLIHEQIDELRLTKDELLYREDEPANHVFTVREGVVKLTHYSQNGDECIVRLLKPGDLAGLESLTEQKYRQTAIVIDDALTCRIPVAVVTKLNQLLPNFKHQLLQRWLDSIEEADAWQSKFKVGSTKTRLASMLLHFTEREKTTEIFVPTLDDIGAMLGITRETANRCWSELKQAGLVEKVTDRRFNVNPAGLRLLTRSAMHSPDDMAHAA